jgi:hypothetical protein
MITDVIVKTYPGDYDWLPYLFRSLSRVTGYRHLILLLEKSYPQPEVPDSLVHCTRVARTPDYAPGAESGKAAAIERLGSHRYSDAPRFFFVDSDCVFTRPIDIQADPSININKPITYWRTWEEGAFAERWREPARQTLGYMPKFETMCRYPFCFPRSVMEDFWDYAGGAKRLWSVDTTDWNALGNFAIDHHYSEISARHWSSADPPCVRQFWSHARPTNPEVQEELRAMGLTTKGST